MSEEKIVYIVKEEKKKKIDWTAGCITFVCLLVILFACCSVISVV